jgi:Tol biopolymer transport system component
MKNQHSINARQVSLGVLISAVLNVALIVCYAFSDRIETLLPGFTRISYESVLFVGAVQLIYQFPLMALFGRRGKRGIVYGMVVVASLTLLLNALVFVYAYGGTSRRPSSQNHHILGAVAFSPDGEYIAFSYVKGSSGFLFRARLDGRECKRVTTHTKGFEFNPAFSPDGKHVVYQFSDQDFGWSKIYVADIQTGFSRLLIDMGDDDSWPIFSKDGKTIYFVRSISLTKYRLFALYPQFKRDIFSISSDGSHLEQLTREEYQYVSALSVSTDGGSLLFLSWPQDRRQNQIILLERSKRQQQLKPNMSSLNDPHYQERYSGIYDPWFWPTGDSWMFMLPGNSDEDLYRAEMHSDSVTKVASKLPGVADNFRPSPDGKFIAFVAPQYERSPTPGMYDTRNLLSIYFMRADGSDLRRVKFPVEVE